MTILHFFSVSDISGLLWQWQLERDGKGIRLESMQEGLSLDTWYMFNQMSWQDASDLALKSSFNITQLKLILLQLV